MIGAGSAGAIIASRLSEDSAASVVLIEAGPDYPYLEELPDELKHAFATASYATAHGHLWGYVGRASMQQPPMPFPRGKVTGGTSSINGALFLRGLRADFDEWAVAGNEGWSFAAMLPCFKRIENDLDYHNQWHGSSGPIAVRRYPVGEWLPPQQAFVHATLDAGFADCPDANEPGSAGVGPIPFNNVGGVRASTARAYLHSARQRPNLTVLASATARRLRLNGTRVVAVELQVGSRVEEVAAGEFIVCCGSIGSPHLLMRSGIGPADQLRRSGVKVAVDLPGVGQHLEDHQVVDVLWQTHRGYPIPSVQSPRVQVALRYGADGSGVADDMQITPRTHPPALVPGGRLPEGASVVSLAPCLQQPAGAGELRLVSNEPHVQPEIELNFLADEADRRRLREGVRLCIELAANRSFSNLLGARLTPTDDELASDRRLDEWLARSVRTSHHSAGTCRMGPSADPQTVVDPRCRVQGLSNLRVADASVFPRQVRANTNASVMAVAERAVELIRDQLAG